MAAKQEGTRCAIRPLKTKTRGPSLLIESTRGPSLKQNGVVPYSLQNKIKKP